jgi:catechol 2,3-dioxygenase-like lactoylglutathione lyase family enzyme
MVSVRYIVSELSAAIEFYVSQLGFSVEFEVSPAFALLERGDLRLLLNVPGVGGAGHEADDGRVPEPGGWNRFQLETADLDTLVDTLDAAGYALRTGIVEGKGGRQALVEDPSGNVVELFEAVPPDA